MGQVISTLLSSLDAGSSLRWLLAHADCRLTLALVSLALVSQLSSSPCSAAAARLAVVVSLICTRDGSLFLQLIIMPSHPVLSRQTGAEFREETAAFEDSDDGTDAYLVRRST